ncbi:MAG: M1 family metallopeptidase [Ignavibacteria bacterium]|nr:M1 family metallopeptidase [Ignavibacteria bacterium]
MYGKIISFILAICLFSSNAFSQNFFIPSEIKTAVSNGTRSLDGNPGKEYWQNKSEYSITAEVNSYTKELKGKENIIYHNLSPNDLKIIVIRLYQDFSKPGKSRDWEIDERNLGKGVTVSKLTINNTQIDLQSKDVSRPGTNLVVNLNNLIIRAGENAAINCEWSFVIPNDFPRMGAYDSTSYMVAYWYPQIAVFDDYNGWDMNEHKGQVEFYNDMSDFDVSIKTDRPNMCVWATGLLQNPEEIFKDDVLKKYNDGRNGAAIFEVDCSLLNKDNSITKNSGNNIWRFKAASVPDFAFALSDHYIWRMKEIKTAEGFHTNLNTAFRPGANSLKYDVFTIAEKTLEYLSAEMPAVPYPYPSMTVFNGEGGMEFPMMVNDGDSETWESFVYVTSHEITHSYFPFFMGTNETKYGWMDEGWAVYLPENFQTNMERFAPDNAKKDDSRTDSRAYIVQAYLKNAGTFNDIPMLAPSNQLRSLSYRHNAYSKPALVYDILKDMLGEELFLKTLKEYISRWNHKHPTPYDFFFTVNDYTNKDLNWFWTKWFMQYGVPDLAITAAVVTEGKIEIRIKNKGGMPVPVVITLIGEDGKETVYNKTAEVWKDTDETSFTFDISGKIKNVRLGNKYIPDVFPDDNFL